MRLAASVPTGIVGNTGFSLRPSHQRRHAPSPAPIKTLKNGSAAIPDRYGKTGAVAKESFVMCIQNLPLGTPGVGIISLAAVQGGMPSPDRKSIRASGHFRQVSRIDLP